LKEKEKKEKLTASHPSVKGQRPQEHWIDATGNYRRWTRCPEPSLRLRSPLWNVSAKLVPPWGWDYTLVNSYLGLSTSSLASSSYAGMINLLETRLATALAEQSTN